MIVVETFHNEFDSPIDQVLDALDAAGLLVERLPGFDEEDQWRLAIRGRPEQFRVVARPDVVYCLRDLEI